MNTPIYLSVIIPCFEEMGNLQKGVLDKVNNYLARKKFEFEVIIVDDGSKDGSIEFIESYVADSSRFKLIKNAHSGKAGAVTAGMLKAQGKYSLFTDMDQATPIEEIEKLLPFFDEGYDVIIGSRATTRKGSPLIRQFISRANIVLRKIIVGIPAISDTQCGFKMFRTELSKEIFTKVSKIHNGFKKINGSSVSSGFDVELLYITEKMGRTIKEVPVRWLYVETRRVNPIKDSIDGVNELIKIKKNALSGMYD